MSLGGKLLAITCVALLPLVVVLERYHAALDAYQTMVEEIETRAMADTVFLSGLFARVSSNHGRIFDLLASAKTGDDEERIYEASRPLLAEIHNIVGDLKAHRAAGRSREHPAHRVPGLTIELDHDAIHGALIADIESYLPQAVRAVEMVTVDVALSDDYAIRANEILRGVHDRFISIIRGTHDAVGRALVQAKAETDARKRAFLIIVAVAAATAIGMMLVTARVSGGLSRDLRAVVAVVSKVAAGDVQIAVPFRDRRDEVGEIARATQVFLDNLIVLRRTHAEKLGETEALRESEERFRVFAEVASDYFAVLGEDLRYRYLSNSACDAHGIDPRDVPGARLHNILKLLPGQEEAVAAHVRQLKAHEPFRDFEYAAHGKDGDVRHIQASGRPVFDADGGFKGYYIVGADITGHKALEQQLQQAQKMEAVGQLTGGIAHDFNNLLTVVMGNLQLLERAVRGDARREKQVRMAFDAAKRGSELTKRLLAFSRRQVLAPENANLNALVEGMVPLLKRTLGETIGLEVKRDDTLGMARIDVSQFESALLNLTVNARDAMPAGGKLLVETANARLDARYVAGETELSPGRYVVVSVSDTGTGIPKDIVERVFDPFFTTKEVGKGSGLGLSMVYGFARQSKGNVTIYSEEGLGTTVRMYFPRMAAGPAESETAIDLETIVPGGDETILLVEDEAAVRETVSLILEDYGYTVTAAENGPAALEALQAWNRIDLLLTDVVMPGGMNGRQLADRVKALHPGLKVLITSGYPQETISRDGILEEGIAFIGKPYQHEDLARKIRELLDR